MKLFQWVKEIRSKTGRLHFKRYAIIETKYFACYIHKIYDYDRDIHLHSHPWSFFGLILKGAYVEHYYDEKFSNKIGYRIKDFLSIGYGNRNYYHKIDSLNSKTPVTTLFFTFGKHKPWYYLTGKNLDVSIESGTYRKLKNEGKASSL